MNLQKDLLPLKLVKLAMPWHVMKEVSAQALGIFAFLATANHKKTWGEQPKEHPTTESVSSSLWPPTVSITFPHDL